MTSATPQELHTQLINNSLFQTWKKAHGNAYLSHFFCSFSSALTQKSAWELGYYDPASNKITIFIPLKVGEFEIKPEDSIFKQDTTTVEPLLLEKIQISFEKSQEIFQINFPTQYPKQQLGDGFIILQCLNQNILWNYTFITKNIQFINLKINAITAELDSIQTVDLVDKQNDKLKLSKRNQ